MGSCGEKPSYEIGSDVDYDFLSGFGSFSDKGLLSDIGSCGIDPEICSSFYCDFLSGIGSLERTLSDIGSVGIDPWSEIGSDVECGFLSAIDDYGNNILLGILGSFGNNTDYEIGSCVAGGFLSGIDSRDNLLFVIGSFGNNSDYDIGSGVYCGYLSSIGAL